MARLSLAQQIAQLEDTVPDFDPEDAYNTVKPDGLNEDDIDMEPAQAAREHYLDVGPSTLRKQHDSVSDPKYGGLPTSRSKVFGDDDDTPSEDDTEGSSIASSSRSHQEPVASDDEMDGYAAPQPFGKVYENEDDDQETSEGDDGESVSEEGDADDDDDEARPSKTMRSQATDEGDRQLAEELRKSREQDRIKGKAVAKQLSTWDTLLDARIRLQKSVVAANRLPLPESMDQFSLTDTGAAAIQELLNASLQLSDDLLELQEIYMATNEDDINPPRERRKLDTETEHVASTYESHLKDMSSAVSELEASYHPHRLKTLAKWSMKVQAVAPTALMQNSGGGAGSFRQSAAGRQKSAVDLIDETLAGGKAVARTQVRRAGESSRISGVKQAGVETLDVDQVFDDVDFYQQLLRDVIDSRAGKDNLASLDAADAWARKQKKAQKAERALANKDRRVRYDVHEKLQNFMVPVPVSRGAWHEEQIDELFASLLGKGFEGAAEEMAPLPRDGAGGESIVDFVSITTGDLGGLRVF